MGKICQISTLYSLNILNHALADSSICGVDNSWTG